MTCHFRDLFDLPCMLIRSSINFSEGGFDKSRVSIFYSCSHKLTYLILELDLCNYDNDVPLLFAEWLNGSIKIPELQILSRYMSMIHSDESNKPIQQAKSRNEPAGCSSVCSPGSKTSNRRGPLLDKYHLRLCS